MSAADMSLCRLAARYGTDKGPAGHGYTRHYRQLFAGLRHDPVRLLEVGVWRGGSLRMWERWFPHAEIVGVDINPEETVTTDRVSTVVADATVWEPAGWFDIIVDDGSHRPADVLAAYRRLWPHLAADGWYVIEDMTPAAFDVVFLEVDRNVEFHVFPSLQPPWRIVFLRKGFG